MVAAAPDDAAAGGRAGPNRFASRGADALLALGGIITPNISRPSTEKRNAVDETLKGRGERRAAFGFLRLLFASLVVVAHTSELADGNPSREFFHSIFGTISGGGIAVSGFFIISGYLVSGSYLRLNSLPIYLTHRMARIFPGFAVAFLISLFVFGPLGGGSSLTMPLLAIRKVLSIVFLYRPDGMGAFSDLHVQELNGAMWTIPYEFKCYLVVAFIGFMGWLRDNRVCVLLWWTAVLLACVIPKEADVWAASSCSICASGSW